MGPDPVAQGWGLTLLLVVRVLLGCVASWSGALPGELQLLCQSLLFQLLGTRLTGSRGKREFGEINLGSGKPSAVLSGQPIQPS